jgi:dolichol-phosphate mannosyltransferase
VSTLAQASSSITGRRRDSPVSVDVVVPFWNEETVLGLLLDRLSAVFSPENMARHRVRSVRYVMVDDGSTDGSVSLVAKRIESGLPAVVCRLTRNFGHQNAISAGLDLSRADVVAVIDADLQDPPELILEMIAKWRDGFDVVYAQRRKRRENPLKVAGYWAFYRLVAALADLAIPLDSGDFCLMDRRVVRAVSTLPEKLRFPRGLRAWVGFRQTGLEYDRPTREAGRSKYTLARLYKLATDGVVSSSVRPLQLAQVFSVSYLLLIVAGLAYFAWSSETGLSPVILTGYLLIISGNFVQVLCIYILGAYVGRTYLEVKGRPSYLVMEVIGEEPPGDGDAVP